MTFNGYGGQPIKGWLQLPRQRAGRLPCVVEYIGYGGGRGFPTDWLLWASAGYAHLVMDTRGQGSAWRKATRPTRERRRQPAVPRLYDPRHPATRETYFYRRVFTDAVRAVEAARSHPAIDRRAHRRHRRQPGRRHLRSPSAGWCRMCRSRMPDVPFLCHYRRATEIIDTLPYEEIANY